MPSSLAGSCMGGTAIWRCYSGNRLSEDLDVYIEKRPKKIEQFFQALRTRGFQVEKKESQGKCLVLRA